MLAFQDMEYQKLKSAVKSVLPRGPELKKTVLRTAEVVATVVGGTLGPGGHPVLIERQEFGLPPIITKDGVTVFRSLGFQDAATHCIMEAMRDASIRTATEAGDGTTTATILAEAFTRLTLEYCDRHPSESPQNVIRQLQKTWAKVLEPELNRLSIKCSLEDPEGLKLLHAVASISGNGDTELADAVMECYQICGDEGNVTITDGTGPSAYPVTKIEGFSVASGYEESCQRFYPVFVNRQDLQQVHIEKPMFLLYFGRVNDIQTLTGILQRLQEAWDGKYLATPNIVVVASGFSEAVLASLSTNWVSPGSINIFPLVIPNDSPVHNAQRNFLDDLAAVTGATVFDPVTKPLNDEETFDDLGNLAQDTETLKWMPLGVRMIEVTRYRSTIIGTCQEDILLERVEKVKAQAEQAESELEGILIRERLAKLTGGVANLKIVGSSNGEVKERRDRAEDAICAVRGAIKHGCLPAGGWALSRLQYILFDTQVNREILIPALQQPIKVLLNNAGVLAQEHKMIYAPVVDSVKSGDTKSAVVWDASAGEIVNAVEAGLMDSTPAVREALKNALSIATLLGTLGGCVVFPRDASFEAKESHEAADFNRNANFNPADERP